MGSEHPPVVGAISTEPLVTGHGQEAPVEAQSREVLVAEVNAELMLLRD